MWAARFWASNWWSGWFHTAQGEPPAPSVEGDASGSDTLLYEVAASDEKVGGDVTGWDGLLATVEGTEQ